MHFQQLLSLLSAPFTIENSPKTPLLLCCFYTTINKFYLIHEFCYFSGPVQCNHTYSATAGYSSSFSSPFYPEYYPDNLECHYHFETTLGYVFKFSFNSLRLQNSSFCTKDSLKVYENGALQKVYCGKTSSAVDLISSGNKVLLILRSDDSIFDLGFFAYFRSIIKRKCMCFLQLILHFYNHSLVDGLSSLSDFLLEIKLFQY